MDEYRRREEHPECERAPESCNPVVRGVWRKIRRGTGIAQFDLVTAWLSPGLLLLGRHRDSAHPHRSFLEVKQMPWKTTLKRAKKDKEEGKAPTTQAGEFVREEMEHVRRGKHGARNTKQAIAIGLSKARRSGVNLAPPKKGTTSARTRKSAAYALRERGHKPSSRRSSAVRGALKREGHSAASHS